MFRATVLKVLIATPGDTADEVAAITKSLHSWNGRRAEAENVILLPRHWKADAVPLVDPNGAQSVIDSQLVDSSDIVIAVFDSRLGQATQGAVSGTAYELSAHLLPASPSTSTSQTSQSAETPTLKSWRG